eukprot:6226801-Prymnesium_polylepis.1
MALKTRTCDRTAATGIFWWNRNGNDSTHTTPPRPGSDRVRVNQGWRAWGSAHRRARNAWTGL